MTTAVLYDDRFLEHHTGHWHPESADRLQVLTQHLRDAGLWGRLSHLAFEPAPIELLHRLHAPAYVQRVFDACGQGEPSIDSTDCPVSRRTAEIAQLASGAAVRAVDAVMAGEVSNAFCALRPPGHHAERDRAMGFCFFNHIALAAEHLLTHHDLGRVAVVDFDVHHGNGTQHLFQARSDVLFISLHEDPRVLFPGTGLAHEQGTGPGTGYTLNIPLESLSDDAAYLRAIDRQVLPRLAAYQPQFLLLSAGFDAAADDPLGNMRLTSDGFEQITRRLAGAARDHCHGRVVSLLEGGYDLPSLGQAVVRHVGVLCEAE